MANNIFIMNYWQMKATLKRHAGYVMDTLTPELIGDADRGMVYIPEAEFYAEFEIHSIEGDWIRVIFTGTTV